MSLTVQRPAPPAPAPPPSTPSPERSVTSSRRRSRRRRREHLLFAMFAFPNLALIAVFAYWPVIGNAYLSLTRWDMIAPSPTFVGLENYTTLFTDPSFLRVLRITGVWVVSVVGVSLAGGLALALLFATKVPGRKAVSALVFSPHILSGAAVAAVWLFVFDPNYGLSRVAFSLFGMDSPHWTTSSSWALPALIIVAVWKGVGFVAIVYLAALQSLPGDVLEAARLDGAGRWKTFRHIIFPLLSPTTFFLTVTQIIGAFQSFDLIAMMTGGGPAEATTTLSWFIYSQGFMQFKAGTAAAGAMIMFVLLLVVTVVQMRYVEKKVHY
ncbi:glycerol-3-phosphate ABC transporter permease [Prescottella equi]|uniref:ABC transporter, permease protein n=1 Tax=Prescottella equi ATCC 33707 TaxID=525370 RepID=E9T1X8_RHOHA|nr:ABC transporter, permease protein [Prescottella equi ATCC 33707]OQQ25219.1 glycerol-3-phosphate ABC transporter permease [Prescottella equi]OQQ25484.1 glycerol-3-phosphate ABC transporter permease [Prescottella equi]OQQ27787.1 glycerol-3-phosphate ABC transporter permease [Prescottella equi]OQQ35485.1 glycerol-3-phosphate ABC transporter permease [Prescottella equi]